MVVLGASWIIGEIASVEENLSGAASVAGRPGEAMFFVPSRKAWSGNPPMDGAAKARRTWGD